MQKNIFNRTLWFVLVHVYCICVCMVCEVWEHAAYLYTNFLHRITEWSRLNTDSDSLYVLSTVFATPKTSFHLHIPASRIMRFCTHKTKSALASRASVDVYCISVKCEWVIVVSQDPEFFQEHMLTGTESAGEINNTVQSHRSNMQAESSDIPSHGKHTTPLAKECIIHDISKTRVRCSHNIAKSIWFSSFNNGNNFAMNAVSNRTIKKNDDWRSKCL